MTTKKKPTAKEAMPGCVLLFVIALGIWFYFSLGSDDDQSGPEDFSSIQARIAVEECVRAYLTSPGSAKFEPYSEKKYVRVNDTLFKFHGWVDSQNSFGALLRTNFRGSLIYYPDRNTTKCGDIHFY